MKALLRCFTAGVIVCTVLRSEHVKTRKKRIRRKKMSKQSDKFQVSKRFLCSFVFFWRVLVTLYGGVMGLDPPLGTFPRAFGATENVYDFDVSVLFRSAIWDRSVHRKNQNKNDAFFKLFPSIPSGALSRLALFHSTGNFPSPFESNMYSGKATEGQSESECILDHFGSWHIQILLHRSRGGVGELAKRA